MGSEHKSKKRGRSTSPVIKKKSKRKYRNDRSKKSRQSSSESSSEEEEISLTSDEYPSSADEKRKEEKKKKRPKKSKPKSRASRSASSSRSPSLEKVKKKSKYSKDEDSRSKHKKDRKRSPSSKKSKRRKSRSEDSDSSESEELSPIKKEKTKKKRVSVSPSRSKKKKSVSPSPVKEDKKKKRGSVSPPSHRSKKKSSPSPPPSRKEKRRSRSTTPKRGKSDKKRTESPTHKSKDKSSPSRRKKSASPPPTKEKKKSSSQKESSSPGRHDNNLSSRRQKESPAPSSSKKDSHSSSTKSSPHHRSKRESDSPVASSFGKSSTPDRHHSKKESRKDTQSPVLPSLSSSKHDKKSSDGSVPVQHPLKCPSPTSTSKMLSAKADGKKSETVAISEANGSSIVSIKSSTAAQETLPKVSSNGASTDGVSKENGHSKVLQQKAAVLKTDSPSPVVVKNEKPAVKPEKEAIPFLGNSSKDATPVDKDIDPTPVDPDAPVIKPPEPSKKSSSSSKTVKTENITLNPLTVKNKINFNSLSSINLAAKETKKSDEFIFGQVKKSDSPSVFRSRKKSPSPSRHRKKSRSASPSRTRKKSRSASPSRTRRRSKSPKRKRSRSRSPSRRNKSPSKQRRRSRSSSPRSKKDRERSPDKKKEKRKDDEREKDKDRDKSRRKDDDHRRNRDERAKEGEKDRNGEKDRKKKDEKDVKRGGDSTKREKSPDKKDINELEDEMKKRKERIEAWRSANRKKDGTSLNGDDESDEKSGIPEKKWNLEDDSDEDEEEQMDRKKETKKNKDGGGEVKSEAMEVEEESDDDPLDSFMKGIDTEVHKLTGKPANTTTGGNSKTKTVTVVKTVVTTAVKVEQVKPEVIEQNQDALEYSSEEETTNDIQASDFVDTSKKKKELTVADHSKIYYAPFRRDFYVEVPELARMTNDEVKLMRDGLGDIQVRGKNSPKPIKSWAQAGLSSKIMNVLKKCQYEKPTNIQAQALPIAMSGRDMIGIAKTGSGKTLAFVLPMLRHVLDQPALDEDDGPIAIIMTPTRELALQIYRESKKFCKALNLQVTCIYGGSGISEQIAELKRGTEIIVCTPGRMIDMLAANNGRVTNCRRCTYLVLDEADRMFDMGFEPQVMRILDNIRPDRQTVLFSATFPRQMEAMARKVLTKPIEVQVGGRSVVCSDVEQHAIVIEEDNKFFKILELLGVYQEKGSILLFVERQEAADRLFKDLLKKGYPCLSLHGGMDQFDRDSTIADFKNGVTKLMVSTSVAARGLDVKNLNLVVNFDCPNHYEDYVHRVGRTGRAGNKGTAFTFLTPEQGRNAGDIIKAFELSKAEVPQDVRSLWTIFTTEMEKEGKTIKMNSGFSGKGFKFNAEEDAMVNESKKMRKFTLGLQDSDDEAEAAENAMDKIEADLEKIFSSKPKVALQPEVVEAQKVKVQEQNVDQNKLKQASNIAALINKKLSSGQVMDRNTAATAHIMQGGALESLTGVGLAKQLADKVNAKLNYKAVEVETPVEEKPTLVRYEDEIDINDFPQQARWRITSKEIIEQVRELSEAGVTVRGLYIPPNKKPTEEEKRLHLYIESLSERSIQIAKAEIKRLLKEELIKSESNTYRPAQQTGRYKVV